jgi:hypothetical protein
MDNFHSLIVYFPVNAREMAYSRMLPYLTHGSGSCKVELRISNQKWRSLVTKTIRWPFEVGTHLVPSASER